MLRNATITTHYDTTRCFTCTEHHHTVQDLTWPNQNVTLHYSTLPLLHRTLPFITATPQDTALQHHYSTTKRNITQTLHNATMCRFTLLGFTLTSRYFTSLDSTLPLLDSTIRSHMILCLDNTLLHSTLPNNYSTRQGFASPLHYMTIVYTTKTARNSTAQHIAYT